MSQEKHDRRLGAERAWKRANDMIDSFPKAIREARLTPPVLDEIELASMVTRSLLEEFPTRLILATIAAAAILRLEQKERAEQADAKS